MEKRYPDGVPRMDPLDDLGIDEPQALAAVRRMEALEAQLATNAAFLVRVLRLGSCCHPNCAAHEGAGGATGHQCRIPGDF